MTRNNQILFVHIPKSAGTSFRVAAEEYFGKENTFYDYAPKAKETSKEVIDYIYEDQNYYKFYEHISKLSHSFLSGHFPVGKYAPLYDTLNVVSFVRNPVEQIISHYNHLKNHNEYKKDLIDFIKEPGYRDLQSRNLKGKHLSFYGFLGLTEEYNLSVEIFNAQYHTALAHKYMNRKKKGSINIDEVDTETIDLIRNFHASDIKFYNNVKEQFRIRKELYKKNLPFTHGFLQKVTKERIYGLAFQKGNTEALEIDIYAGTKYMETVLAQNLRLGQLQHGVPRKGFVGFDYIYNKDTKLEGKLTAIVKSTGQEII